MTNNSIRSTPHDQLRALALMEEALAILDRFPGAEAVAAHLDLAINRLRELLQSLPPAETT